MWGKCHSVCAEVRGQLARAGSLFPPCGSQRLNSGSSGLATRALSNEPFHQPRNVFLPFLGRTPGCGEGAGPGEQKTGLWGGKRSGPTSEAECPFQRRPQVLLLAGHLLCCCCCCVGCVCLCMGAGVCMHAIMYVCVCAHT